MITKLINGNSGTNGAIKTEYAKIMALFDAILFDYSEFKKSKQTEKKKN